MRIENVIVSTTHLDFHDERMSKNALDGMVNQIKEKYIPQLINHDWDEQVGVLLYAEVFQLEDGEYALGVVSGLFDNEDEKNKFKIGDVNTVWQDYKKYLNIEELKSIARGMSYFNSRNVILPNNIELLLEIHLNSTKILPDGRVYKVKYLVNIIGDLQIEVYPKDHNPSHFHVISKQRGINARFDINTLEFINMKNGKIKRGDVNKIQDFFRIHPEFLQKLKNDYQRLQ